MPDAKVKVKKEFTVILELSEREVELFKAFAGNTCVANLREWFLDHMPTPGGAELTDEDLRDIDQILAKIYEKL